MKKNTLLFFLFLFPTWGWCVKDFEGLLSDYYIVSDKEDESVPKNKTHFIISFSEYSGKSGGLASKEILYSINGKNVTQKTSKEAKIDFKVDPGKYKFQFFYNKEHYEIYTDSIKASGGHKVIMNVSFTSSIHPVIVDKPVIYVYPEKSTEVNIRLDFKGEMNFTYPAHNSGWNFTAESDGTIKMNGKEYNYLFWEGTSNLLQKEIKSDEGFIVEKNNLLSFLENSLTQMGLNTKEQADFITYWYPRMMNNEKNYVRFIFNEDYNQYAGIKVNPQPETMFRLFMVWTNYTGEKNNEMKAQKFPTFTRNGFTLVEWGGSEIIIPEN